MITFFDGLGELYHLAKFGEIVQRAPAVGAKMWCFLFVTLRIGLGRSLEWDILLYSYCVAVYGLIFILFSPCFRSDDHTEPLDSSYFCR